jgi:hypothetical protein
MFDSRTRWVSGGAIFVGLVYVGVVTGNCWAKEPPGDVESAPLAAQFVPMATTTTSISVGSMPVSYTANMTGDEPIKQMRESGLMGRTFNISLLGR